LGWQGEGRGAELGTVRWDGVGLAQAWDGVWLQVHRANTGWCLACKDEGAGQEESARGFL
jgi:hypothetical protein